MSKKLSCIVTDFLVCRKVIEQDEIEIYRYGYEAFFSCLGQTLILISIGAVFGKLLYAFLFVLVFVCLRQYAGGYHAKTRIGCTIVTSSCMLMNLMFVDAISELLCTHIVEMGFMVICYFLSMCVAPAWNSSGKISEDKRKEYLVKLYLYSFLFIFVAVFALKWNIKVSYSVLTTMDEVALLAILTKERRVRNEADE